MSKKVIDITIVAANYNNAQYLNDFFYSIINSSVIPKELIIVDDGSIDNSVEIIETFLSYDFIKLIKLDKNQGFANALNIGVRASSGKFIVRVDPDDIVMPERLERQFSFLNDNSDIDLVGGNVIYFNSDTGRDISTSNFPQNHNKILSAYKCGDHGIQHPTVCVRAEVFKNYSYNQDTYPAEDYDIFARMINDGYKFANIVEAVNRMRVHSKSVSNKISYKTINKTFALREDIFNIKSSSFQRKRYFKYISNYRKFLFARNFVLKSLYILISALYYPEKAVKKIFSSEKFSIQLSYYLFFILFITDSIVNYFVRIPIFVSGGIILLLFHFELLRRFKLYNKLLVIIIFSFIIVGISNSIVHYFHVKNISDLFFILLFVTSYFLYKNNPQSLTKKMVWVFLIGCVILIIPSFLGINKWQMRLQIIPNDLESMRLYTQGFFRVPHIGSYFFGFLSLFFGYQYTKTKKYIYLVVAILTFLTCFYIGVRTFLAAAALSVIIFLIIKKNWKTLIVPIVLLIVLIVFIDQLIEATEGTFVFQYLTLIKSSICNLPRLSRLRIWSSWWIEISDFGFLDYLIGKSFIASRYANKINIINNPDGMWFHNDFFSIIFSYGLWNLILYITFLFRIFYDLKKFIISNFFIFTFYFAMVLSACLNGLYYYFPIFLLVPFIYMVNQQKATLKVQ